MNIPIVKIKKDHWKVGDGIDLGDRGKFVIGQMALIRVGGSKEKAEYDLHLYDETGKKIGRMEFILRQE